MPTFFLLAAQVVLIFLIRLPGILLGATFSAIKNIVGKIKKATSAITIQLQDFVLVFLNAVTPPLPKGGVIPKGRPGYGGIWPPFVPPTDQDSRSPCPGLNVLSNHGILPHNGRNITLPVLHKALHETYNISDTLCHNSTNAVVSLFGRDYFDLTDLSKHNTVEHDASMLRHDAYFEPNQTIIPRDLITKFLASATIPPSKDHPEGQVSPADFSRFLSIRAAQSKRDNPTFTLTAIHKAFALNNSSLLYEIWNDGDVAAMRKHLFEERLVDGFEPGPRGRYGLTMTQFRLRNAQIALRVDPTIKL